MQNEKSLNVFIPKMFQWQMQCSYIFAYYLLFYPKFRKKHTIIYIERVALHEKHKASYKLLKSLSENCSKLVMLKQPWK